MVVPRWLIPVGVVLGMVALVPLLLIAWARVSTSEQPRIHLLHDMDHQERYKAQQENPLFADGRAMRSPVAGTVARGELMLDDHYYRGLSNSDSDSWAIGFPSQLTVDSAFLERGRERYTIHCAVCHGHVGDGKGLVALRAEALKQSRDGMTGWATPTNYHDDSIRDKPNGYLYHVISNGVRNMPGYGPQMSVSDRWAVVAYLRALMKSQAPTDQDVAAVRGGTK